MKTSSSSQIDNRPAARANVRARRRRRFGFAAALAIINWR